MRGGKFAVLNYLRHKKSITSKEAFEMFGVTRLAAVVFDLREMGFDIDTVMVEGTTRFGEHCKYARYIYRGE